MNASLLAVLNDAERLLVAQTEPAELATLDEDAAIEFEGRIRRARDAPGHHPRRRCPPAGEARQPVGTDAGRPAGRAPHMRGSVEARSRWAPRFFGEASGWGV
jgi:hypothetical protein